MKWLPRRLLQAFVVCVENRHQGRVYAVDVNSDHARPEVLLFENGEPHVIDTGVRRVIADDASRMLREVGLFNPADRAMLGDMYREMRRMAGLPHPC